MDYNMVNLKEFTKNYMSRTLENSNRIEELYKERRKVFADAEIEDVFEVTQLVNSLVGILVVSFESVKALNGRLDPKKKKDINEKMRIADSKAFDDLSKLIQTLKDTDKFYDTYTDDFKEGVAEISFVERLRNSLAHSGHKGLRFYPIGENDQEVGSIESIIFCNEYKNDSFIVELSVEQVKTVLQSVAAIFGNFNDFEAFYDLDDYQKDICRMREKLNGKYEGVFDFDKRGLQRLCDTYKNNFRYEQLDESTMRGYLRVHDEDEFIKMILKSYGKMKLVQPESLCKKLNRMAKAVLE